MLWLNMKKVDRAVQIFPCLLYYVVLYFVVSTVAFCLIIGLFIFILYRNLLKRNNIVTFYFVHFMLFQMSNNLEIDSKRSELVPNITKPTKSLSGDTVKLRKKINTGNKQRDEQIQTLSGNWRWELNLSVTRRVWPGGSFITVDICLWHFQHG